MSDTVFHACGEKRGEDALAEALTSQSPITRIMARGVAASWLGPFTAWVNEELNRPRAVPSEVLHAVASLHAQTVASIAAQVLDARGDEAFVRLYLEIQQEEIPAHMRRTRHEITTEGWPS